MLKNTGDIMKFDVFIFDLDGTIIDSEKQHCDAYNIQLKENL